MLVDLESLPVGFVIDYAPMADESKSIKGRVQDWLLEDDFRIEEHPREGVAWRLVAYASARKDRKSEEPVVVLQRSGKLDEVYVKLTVTFDERIQAALAKSSTGDRDSFYGEVQFFLLSQRVEFEPQGKTIWTLITISDRIFEDALTKDRLIRLINNVRRSALGVGWLLRDALPKLTV